MLRSAYRTNLEMTSLADNKANMLISVNGLILSVMIATGGFSLFMGQSWLQIVPITALALTSFSAMVCAILVARPRVNFSWQPKREDFDQDRANPLLFMHFQSLNEKEYLDMTYDVMNDRDRLYRHMVTHNYGMGVVLAKKFKLLRVSYNVFMVGLGISVLLFILVNTLPQGQANDVTAAGTDNPAGHTLTLDGIYEPSAVAALHNGRLMVFEDEADRPWKILNLSAQGRITAVDFLPAQHVTDSRWKTVLQDVNDIEAAEADARGNIYVLTSHSRRERDGAFRQGRNRFLRFVYDGQTLDHLAEVSDLVEQLTRFYPEMAQAAKVKSAKQENGLNMEGLAIDPKDGSLLIGFRSPLEESTGQAYIARLLNPEAVFTEGQAIRFAPDLTRLSLGKGGIRGMSYSARLGAFLLISGRANRHKVPFALWSWSGRDTDPARPLVLRGWPASFRAEAVVPVKVDGKEQLLIFSDDGNQASRRPAQYLLLDLERLIASPDTDK